MRRLTLGFLLLGWSSVWALSPAEVVILVNRNEPAGAPIAAYYCQKRNVPTANVVTLDLPKGEDISRADYDAKLAKPLRTLLKEKFPHAQVLLSVYGVPLRVGEAPPSAAETKAKAELAIELAAARAAHEAQSAPADKAAAAAKVRQLEDRERTLNRRESQAAVDSELMLVLWPEYELARWLINPLFWQVSSAERRRAAPVLMTARLDGPTPALAQALVDRAVAGEAAHLAGKVYVDARGIAFDAKNDAAGLGYGGFDESMREMARLLESKGKFTVVLDDKPELFKPQSCPDCALYCGWYSHANFIDCCTFAPGAVAWHLASSEAVSLRQAKSKLWCPRLLEAGVAVTIGPVAEPYTLAFPKPAEFFGFLATGDYTVVECFARTTLLTSWQMTLIGDPLYNPFAKQPRLQLADVQPSPKGVKSPLRP
jgi:uncharacterized protein (TIGR03790 family)